MHYTLTPSNTVDLVVKPRAIVCTVAGNVVIRDAAGTQITYAVAVGQVMTFRPTRIMATGTTATLVGWE